LRRGHTIVVMDTILSAVVFVLSFSFRRRTSLELELVALRHKSPCCGGSAQVGFRSSRQTCYSGCWLYRIWPRALNAMVLVKPATLIQWHGKGFSGSIGGGNQLHAPWGGPKVSAERPVI
jgi:putative transposase